MLAAIETPCRTATSTCFNEPISFLTSFLLTTFVQYTESLSCSVLTHPTSRSTFVRDCVIAGAAVGGQVRRWRQPAGRRRYPKSKPLRSSELETWITRLHQLPAHHFITRASRRGSCSAGGEPRRSGHGAAANICARHAELTGPLPRPNAKVRPRLRLFLPSGSLPARANCLRQITGTLHACCRGIAATLP